MLSFMGFFNDNNLTLNNVEIARRKRVALGLPLTDLTESNPTKCALIFPKDILAEAALNYINSRRYQPDSKGLKEARRAIADYYKRRAPKLDISVEQIIITASTSEAYRLLFSLLCEPHDNLLAPDVTYPLFEYFALDQRIELHNYKIAENRDWDFEPTSIDLALDQHSKGILIVSPHNPTGKIQRKTNEIIAHSALPLIVDEVFAEFVHDGGRTPVLAELYPELPVFHLNGISKMFALPDMKLGWIAMNKKAQEIYGERLEFLNDTYLSASSLIQSALPMLFEKGLTFQKMMTERVRQNVFYVKEKLEQFGFPKVSLPQGGTFILPQLPDELDEEEFVIRLINAGLALHPGYFYNVPHNHIMISCLPEFEVVQEGLEIIEKNL